MIRIVHSSKVQINLTKFKNNFYKKSIMYLILIIDNQVVMCIFINHN